MNEDLLALVKKIKDVKDLDELKEAQELGDSLLRKEKRNALLTLLAISEELGEEEIYKSIKDLSKHIETVIQNSKDK